MCTEIEGAKGGLYLLVFSSQNKKKKVFNAI
jgi:hypothetical protein